MQGEHGIKLSWSVMESYLYKLGSQQGKGRGECVRGNMEGKMPIRILLVV